MSGSAGESKPQAAGANGSALGGGMAGIPSGEPGGWLTMKRGKSGPEWFRQMQLDMLCKENANLATKLVPALLCPATQRELLAHDASPHSAGFVDDGPPIAGGKID